VKTSLVILAFSAVLPALAQRPDLEKLKSEVVA